MIAEWWQGERAVWERVVAGLVVGVLTLALCGGVAFLLIAFADLVFKAVVLAGAGVVAMFVGLGVLDGLFSEEP